MKYLTEVTAEEKKEIDRLLAFTKDQSFNDKYEFNSDWAIAGSVEDWMERGYTCCGSAEFALYLSSGRRVFFCFTYGH